MREASSGLRCSTRNSVSGSCVTPGGIHRRSAWSMGAGYGGVSGSMRGMGTSCFGFRITMMLRNPKRKE